ncbi:MAG: hypothetical protein ACRCT2_01645 [Plesiomonas shigelloides]
MGDVSEASDVEDPFAAVTLTKATGVIQGIKRSRKYMDNVAENIARSKKKAAESTLKLAKEALRDLDTHVGHVKNSWSNQKTAKVNAKQERDDLRVELVAARAEISELQAEITTLQAQQEDDRSKSDTSSSGSSSSGSEGPGALLGARLLVRMVKVYKQLVPVSADVVAKALFWEARPSVGDVPLTADGKAAMAMVMEETPRGIKDLEKEFVKLYPNYKMAVNGQTHWAGGGTLVALERSLPSMTVEQRKQATDAYKHLIQSLKNIFALGESGSLSTSDARGLVFGLVVHHHSRRAGKFGLVETAEADGEDNDD